MTDPVPFQYSLIQYGHDLVTGEWLNIGLAIYCSERRYLNAKVLLRYQRLTQAFPGANGEFYRSYMGQLQTRLKQLSADVVANKIDIPNEPSSLEKLLATVLKPDDVSIRFGEIRGGLTDNLDVTFDSLYLRLVERYLETTTANHRSDADVLSSFRDSLRAADLFNRLPPKTIQTPLDSTVYPHAWKNGAWNLIQPVSFDLKRTDTIKRKAQELIGEAAVIKHATEDAKLVIILGKPVHATEQLQKAYQNARTTLEGEANRLALEVVEEDKTDGLIDRIKHDVEAHAE